MQMLSKDQITKEILYKNKQQLNMFTPENKLYYARRSYHIH